MQFIRTSVKLGDQRGTNDHIFENGEKIAPFKSSSRSGKYCNAKYYIIINKISICEWYQDMGGNWRDLEKELAWAWALWKYGLDVYLEKSNIIDIDGEKKQRIKKETDNERKVSQKCRWVILSRKQDHASDTIGQRRVINFTT